MDEDLPPRFQHREYPGTVRFEDGTCKQLVTLCSSLEDRVRRPCDMSGYVLSATLTRTRREPPRWATSEVKGNHWAGVVINSVRRGWMAPRMNDHVVNRYQRIEGDGEVSGLLLLSVSAHSTRSTDE